MQVNNESTKKASIFAPKAPPAPPSDSIPSSSTAFGTPAHTPRPFAPPAPKATILPILLPPATLRPLAFRTFTKKHSLTLTSSALQELATFIGRHCGSGWREEGLAEKVLEEVAKSWKNRNGGVIVDGASSELKDILKSLEGNMSGGRIVTGRELSRQDSLALEPGQEADLSNTRLGLRPAHVTRDDSAASFGMSGLDVEEEEPDDDGLNDPRKWIKIRLLRNEAFQSSAVAVTKGPPSLKRSSSSTLTSQQTHKITPIANLLGRHGSHHMLLGQLSILPTGNLAISDLTGTIALDLRQAVAIPEDSAWFTPGMIVLVDGVYEEEEESSGKGLSGSNGIGGIIGGRFQGFFIGQPPCEKRKATLGISGPDGGPDHTIGGGFGWIDFLGVGSERAAGARMRKLEQRILHHHRHHRQRQQQQQASPEADAADALPSRGRVVILGELNLDQPRALEALRKILATYGAEPEGCGPMAFVLAGNFAQHAVMAGGGASGGSVEYKEYFDALASVLADFPTLLQSATFVFVPGDNDGWASSFGAGAAVPLPRRPVPDMFTSRVRRAFAAANAEPGANHKVPGEAVWTSNPARLSVFGPVHEIVLFRDDMAARMRRAAVRLNTSSAQNPDEDDAGEENPPGGDGDDDVEMDTAAGALDQQGADAMDVDGAAPEKKSPRETIPHDLRTARRLVKTVLDQGYLCPFRDAARPVHWDYGAAAHLYPLPTALVLVDPTAPPFCLTYEGCHVVNPGALLVTGRRGVARWAEYELGGVGRIRECMF
ncbi:hypothetical protein DL764_010967 [Monosporascus ibericus]|uniref:DNA polymerase epsilon subunit B n=1 Tax=Monosporascus ibericus TaxID=155417 RepID=A0A4Q4STL8_9PEZI|nr:hypothetical protein DL764_010967 [Monosporascus ibericus]